MSFTIYAQIKPVEFSILTAKVPNDTLRFAIHDLQDYLVKTVSGSRISLLEESKTALLKGTVIVLMDQKDKTLRSLAKAMVSTTI